MNPWLRGNRWLRYGMVAAVLTVLILLHVLTSATSNSAFFEQNYALLLKINFAVVTLLMAITLFFGVRLIRRYRRGVFGSRLMVRMAFAFALTGLVPGALLYVASAHFLARSIDSWFNVRVDKALESGVTLGQLALDSLLRDLSDKTVAITADFRLAESKYGDVYQLNRIRDQLAAQEVWLLNSSARIVAAAGKGEGYGLSQNETKVSATQLRKVLLSQPLTRIELVGESLQLWVIAKIPSHKWMLDSAEEYLVVVSSVSPELTARAQAVQSVYEDYQQLSLSRSGLRQMYGITLTLAMCLAVLAALLAAFLLSSRLAAPLLWLAERTRAVAKGDFQQMSPVTADGELRELISSFNLMTIQLSQARNQLEAKQFELSDKNYFLQNLLSNLSAGVLVFDRDFRLTLFNDGSKKIFELDFSLLVGKLIDDEPRLFGFMVAIRAGFVEHELAYDNYWQKQLEIPRHEAPVGNKVLLVKGSRLHRGTEADYVVLCDDVSALISAQRTLAWGEVARRLAHEIKNPLTPIQLSAERLQMKLHDKLDAISSGILERATKTIINQVSAMKRMVDDFRDYARLPRAELKPIQLNDLVIDVLALYDANEPGPGSQNARISAELAPRLPKMLGDTSQLRQVIHNLLQNGHDAISGMVDGCVVIRTEYGSVPSVSGEPLFCVRLQVSDNGPGFTQELLVRAGEPYVTTKPKGTGLGLAIVRKIADEHAAKVSLRNRMSDSGVVRGAVVELTFAALGEPGLVDESAEVSA